VAMPPRMGKVRNGGQRHGLWRWSAGDIVPDDAVDNPRVRDCPTCQAPATKPCRRRSRAGLVAMTGYHPNRRLNSETAPSPGW